MSRDGYDRMLELVAENPAHEAEEVVEMATELVERNRKCTVLRSFQL